MNEAIKRYIQLLPLLEKKSYFLLGARQTGKSSLIDKQLSHLKKYDLLLHEDFKKLSFNPSAIREELTAKDKIIIIDEIQKLPELLDVVHYLIEKKGIHFLLTGSSARKLKRKGINTLGGRARIQHFHPLTFFELQNQFDLSKVMERGLLPSIYLSDDPNADLDAYLSVYLQQEVANEGLTRNLPAFSRFLEVAATCQGEQVDFTSISNDAQIARTTVHDYFQVLIDTLVGHELSVWGEGTKRKPVATPKFYFFDWGVAKKLMGHLNVPLKSPLFGKAFESFIFQELLAYTNYHRSEPLKYWRTQDKKEVDFILSGEYAVEVKGKSHVTLHDLDGLRALQEEKSLKKYFLIYAGAEVLRLDAAKGIEILPYQLFLSRLWLQEL